jgi:uncharacterized membrane protein YqjE
MPTPGSENRGVGESAKQVADHAKALVGLELELASLELKRKLGSLGLGIGLGVGAALFGLFALGFLLAGLAAALALILPNWLALLIVGVGLLVIAGILAALGLRRIKRGTPPVPEQAIHEAKLTTEALKSDGSL